MSFMSRWAKEEKAGFADRIKRTIRPPPPLKPRIEDAQKKLQMQITRLDSVHSKLKEKDEALFRKVVVALQQHDMQFAAVLSSELSQVRKIGRMVSHAKLALEQIHIRLSTITELGDVVLTLSPAMAVVKNVRTGLTGMIPEVDSGMDEISQVLNGFLVESSQVANSSIPYGQSVTDNDAQSIMDEAASIVENNMKDKLPDLPFAGVKTKVAERSSDESSATTAI